MELRAAPRRTPPSHSRPLPALLTSQSSSYLTLSASFHNMASSVQTRCVVSKTDESSAQPPPTGGKSTSALGKRSCPPDGAQLAGMKADDGLNLHANGHSGFFPCSDALNGNRIIITPPQGWLGSRGRQPLRRERAAPSHSFRAALRARGGVGRQCRAEPSLLPSAPPRARGGSPGPREGVVREHHPHTATRLPQKAPHTQVFDFLGWGKLCRVCPPPHTRGRTLPKSAWEGAVPVRPRSAGPAAFGGSQLGKSPRRKSEKFRAPA